MPRYDLNGNPLPDDPAAAAVTPVQQYDLTGNSLPQQPPAQPAPPQIYSPGSGQQPYGAQPPPPRQPPTYFDGKQFRFTNEPQVSQSQMTTQWLTGLAMALGVGILGYIGVMKLVAVAGTLPVGKGFLVLNMLVAACVGGAVRYAAGKGGMVAAGVTVPVLAVSLLAGHLAYTSDLIGRYPHALAGATVFSAFPRAMANLTFFHWMGVVGSFGVGTAVAFKEE